jgi:gamma-glutamyl:cysteine ligase YbdK (ATP-grasp superfamily)
MGSEIAKKEFCEEDFRQFHKNLRKETRILMEWFSSNAFDKHLEMCGFELEGWLVDRHCAPAPRNEEFLRRVNSPLVVPELSKYNFELNIAPHPLDRNLPEFLNRELQKLWNICTANARDMGCHTLMIGILPTLQDRMLTLRNISSLQRFHALNREILRARSRHPIRIHIEGASDSLEVVHHDVMAEAATTSLQIHYQVPISKAASVYNIAHVLSAPMVALTANSPFLFGRELWDETRIPLFEQAVKTPAFVDLSGRVVSRVTFGRDYVRDSLREVFLENLDGFPVLLPVTFDRDFSLLNHLRLHNGTIWRWNRPLIGFGEDGRPHVRIEHRVPPAGPSIPDIVANILFFYGAILHLQPEAPQRAIPFEQARANFYAASRFGLDALLTWSSGNAMPVEDLLLQQLIPGAMLALAERGINSHDLKYYLGDILARRAATRRNGAWWQKTFISRHGPDFRAMTRAYLENQSRNIPVHEWSI